MTKPSSRHIEHESGDQQYSLRDVLTIVFKRRLLILAVLVLSLVIGAVIVWRTPKMYEVTANLLVNDARAEMTIAPTESSASIVKKVSEEDLNTEIEVLKSRKLIEETARSLMERGLSGVDSPPAVVGGLSQEEKEPVGVGSQPDFDSVVLRIKAGLDVSVVKKSNVIRVSYQSPDPVWATRVVETHTDEYLKQRAQRNQSPQAVEFFEQQMKSAEKRLRETNKALEDFTEKASLTLVEGETSDSLAAEKASLLEQLSSLQSSLVEAEVDYESQTRKVESLRKMLESEPERLESSSQTNMDASTSEVERALMSLKLERDRLLQDFKPDSRHVRDIDAQIQMAEQRLEQARQESSVSGTEANPVYTELKSELLRAQVLLEGTSAKVQSLRNQVAECRKKIEPLNAVAFDLENLQRNVRTAEEDYLLYRKKHEEARISAAMDQEKFINVTVAQPAQMPLGPEPRKVVPKIVLSVLLGLLGGVGLAFAQEMFLDRTFTTAEDLERRLGIPHIASIPDGDVAG